MVCAERQHEIEQFLYHEARLLEERRFEEWLGLLTEDVVYWIPNAREDGDVLEDAVIVYEDLVALKARVLRSLDPHNPTQMPAPRTKYFVTNVEVDEPSQGEVQVRSSLLLYVVKDGAITPFPITCHYRLRKLPAGLRVAYKKIYLVSNLWALTTLPLV
jgi:3-phenylpropionate/cinnamic acid dioxygenase small subunit